MTIRFVAEVMFWLSAAALVYTYVGYPLLVSLISMIRPRPLRRAPYEPMVSVIITAYNEELDLG